MGGLPRSGSPYTYTYTYSHSNSDTKADTLSDADSNPAAIAYIQGNYAVPQRRRRRP